MRLTIDLAIIIIIIVIIIKSNNSMVNLEKVAGKKNQVITKLTQYKWFPIS